MTGTRYSPRIVEWTTTAVSVGIVLLFLTGSTSAAPARPSAPGATYALTEIAGPSPVTENLVSGLVWDPELGHEVALSFNAAGTLGTYELVGAKWKELRTGTPQVQQAPCYATPYLAYDASDRYLVLLTAVSNCGLKLWEYSGTHWTYVSVGHSAPASDGDASPGLMYDSESGTLLLYAGDFGYCDCATGEIFSYHAGTWTQLPNAPVGADLQNLVDNPGIGKLVALGNLEEAWTSHDGTWSRLWFHPPIYFTNTYPITYDPAIGGLLVAGNTYTNSCPGQCYWLWKAGSNGFINITAKTLNPSVACDGASYDPLLSAVVCVGSPNATPPYGIWEFT
ncbi:MAG: hypothetical protein WB778_03090 [Thermoplasmata archaeon]